MKKRNLNHEDRKEFDRNFLNGNLGTCREVVNGCSKLDIVNLISMTDNPQHTVIAFIQLILEYKEAL